MMNETKRKVKYIAIASWQKLEQMQPFSLTTNIPSPRHRLKLTPLGPLREWLNNLDVRDSKLAHLICRHIPAYCPFERDLKLFGRTIVHIPPLCKLNPVYEEVVFLRFRALSYLADECGEDVSAYC